MICKKISKINAVNDKELDEYVSRIMGNMTQDQLTDLEQSPYPYVLVIEKKVKKLLQEHAIEQFNLWVEQEQIICKPFYSFPKMIAPAKTISSIPKSLYEEEEQFDTDYEKKWYGNCRHCQILSGGIGIWQEKVLLSMEL